MGHFNLYLCLSFCLKVSLYLEPTTTAEPPFVSHHNEKSQTLPLGSAIIVATATKFQHDDSV
jgi:hypothetical protein